MIVHLSLRDLPLDLTRQLRALLSQEFEANVRTGLNRRWLTVEQAGRLSAGLFDCPPVDENSCAVGDCPVAPDGGHAHSVMNHLRFWSSATTPASTTPVVDGLAPVIIVPIKGHAAIANGQDLLASFQWDEVRDGQPETAGGVLIRVPMPALPGDRRPEFGMAVAVSGARNIFDHDTAVRLGTTASTFLLMEGVIAVRRPHRGSTFLKGVEPADVQRLIAGTYRKP